MKLKEIDYRELKINPMTLFSDDWLLLTAGNQGQGYNTMTVSWGHLGAIWGDKRWHGKPTAVVYVRPQRYTKQFIDSSEMFTLSVFGEEFRKQLAYLGTHSGKDENKIEKAGLTPLFLDNITCFEQAKLVLVCKKLYHAPLMQDGFVDKSLLGINYPKRDFHEMYVGEITKVFIA